MSCVNIRGCRIGEGRPKVILPIVERTEAAILERLRSFQPCQPIVWNGGRTGSMAFSPLLPLSAACRSCGSPCGTSFCW